MRREDAAHAVPAVRYGSLAAFYRADPRRLASRELDIGLWWRDGRDGPLHRAAWVTDTGELYLVRLGPEGAGGGRVEMLASVADRERLQGALEGWRERCGEPCSLAWLRERARRLAPRPAPPLCAVTPLRRGRPASLGSPTAA
jgi:hypothetical protein